MNMGLSLLLVYLLAGLLVVLALLIASRHAPARKEPDFPPALGALILVSIVAWPLVCYLILRNSLSIKRVTICGWCKQEFKTDAEASAHALVCQQSPLAQSIATLEDTVKTLSESHDDLWGLLYPDEKQSWDYPGEIYAHIRVELDARRLAFQHETQRGRALAQAVLLFRRYHTMTAEMFKGVYPEKAGWTADDAFASLETALNEFDRIPSAAKAGLPLPAKDGKSLSEKLL